VLIAAFCLHGAILFLPAVHSRGTPAVASPVPDLPVVWRASTPAIAPPPQPEVAPPTAVPDEAPPAVPSPAPTLPTRMARPIATEPVPEPAPELGLAAISGDVVAIIPNPDAPPPIQEFGPPSRVAPATPSELAPKLIEQVPPVFPVAARSLRAEGRVTLRLAVLPDGSVGQATVLECTRHGLGFEAAALAAVKRWRYEPAPPNSGARRVLVSVHFQQDENRP